MSKLLAATIMLMSIATYGQWECSGSGLYQEVNSLKYQVKTLQNQVKVLMSSVVTKKRRAFHAAGSGSFYHIDLGRKIHFNSVKVNHHGGYNAATSIFTCDNSGLYYFYVTIASYSGSGYSQVWFQIMQDNKVREYGVTGGGSGAVGSLFAMIYCKPGSHVWVRQGHGRPTWKQGMWAGHSQFGGFELFV